MLAVIIILFIVGIGILVAGFVIKDSYSVQHDVRSDEYLEQMLEERMNQVEHRLGQSARMSASTIKRQTEEELEKLSKEKLSAVDEYSDQVMDRINKNHSEVMFLYGLLSDKQKELDQTVESLNNAQRELQISNRLNMQEMNNSKKDDGNKFNVNDRKKDLKPKEESSVDKRAAIMELAEEGMTDVEIAKQLSMGVGEVRLFLELGKGV